MKPILFSIGPVHIYSFGVFALLAFLAASFVIWREGRDGKLAEDKVLDSIFIVTAYFLVISRLGYMLFHFGEFSPNLLRFFLLWKFPGLSLGFALIGMVWGLFMAARKKKFLFWQIADIFSLGLCMIVIFGGVGALFDGGEVGRVTGLPFGVPFAGFTDQRHPLGVYEMGIGITWYLVLSHFKFKWDKQKRPFGIVATLTGLLLGLIFFTLAFFKEDSVYLSGLSFNQIAFAVFSFLSGVFLYKRLGRVVREDLQKLLYALKLKKMIV